MREMIIGRNDAGQRLDKFLLKAVPGLPKTMMYKFLRTKYIKLNGKKAEISQKLSEGDKVTFYIRDEFFERDEKRSFLDAKSDLNIVFEDENILLADKPGGLIVHEDEGESIDTLINRVKRYLYDKGEYRPDEEASFAPALCNRIDRNTGGIVIVAKNAESLRLLNECIKNRELHKYYLCLTKGVPKVKAATLEHFMRKDEKENKAIVFDKPIPGGKTMITRYEVKKTVGRIALIEVELKTGRTHQIRAHMAYIGCPLVGDGKYSDNRAERPLGFDSQALYSYKLIFDFKEACALSYLNGKVFEVRSVDFASEPVMKKLADALGGAAPRSEKPGRPTQKKPSYPPKKRRS